MSPLPVCATVGKLPNPCKTQFPHMENGESIIQTNFAVRIRDDACQPSGTGKDHTRKQSKLDKAGFETHLEAMWP